MTATQQFAPSPHEPNAIWFFDNKVTQGPLSEFEYINRTSNVFGSYTRFEATEDFSHALVGGERYNHPLSGRSYIGFNFRADHDFDVAQLSSRFLTTLGEGSYLAAELTHSFLEDSDDIWALSGDYYFNERTRLGLGLQLGLAENPIYSIELPRFFTDNVAVELGYTTSRNDKLGLDLDVDIYRLNMTIQL